MGIWTDISANLKINNTSTKVSGTVSSLNTNVFDNIKEKIEDVFLEQTSQGSSGKTIETLNVNQTGVVDVNLTSCTKEEYNQLLTEQLTEYDTNIALYEKMLEECKQKRDELTELRISLDIVSAEYDVSVDQQATDAQVTNMIIADMTGCPQKRLDQLGITQEDFQNYNLEELTELYKEKIPEIKSLYDNAGTMYDERIRQNSEYDSYEELKTKIEEVENDIAILETTIRTLNNQKGQVEYNLLPLLEDYQNFEVMETISLENIRTCISTDSAGYTSISYQKYCQEYGQVSELEFLQIAKENYPNIEIQGLSHQDKLQNILRASVEDENLVKIYEYLYQAEGAEKANQYVEEIEDYTNNLLGKMEAEKFLASIKDIEGDIPDELILNHLRTTGKGLLDGVESFGEGIAAIFKSSDVYTVNEYEAMYIAQGLQEKGQGLSFNYQISQGIGNMLPSIALGTICQPLGSISLGISSGGKSYHNALVEGYDTKTAVIYGIAAGSSDALLERLCGAIPGISKADDSASMIVKMLKEGGQEYAQEILTSGIYDSILLGKEVDGGELLTKQAVDSFIAGAITAGILNTPGKIISVVMNGKSINVDGQQVNAIIENIDNGMDPVEAWNLFCSLKTEIDKMRAEIDKMQEKIDKNAVASPNMTDVISMSNSAPGFQAHKKFVVSYNELAKMWESNLTAEEFKPVNNYISDSDEINNTTINSVSQEIMVDEKDTTIPQLQTEIDENVVDSKKITDIINVPNSVRLFQIYEKFVDAYNELTKIWESSLTAEEIELINNYISESDKSSYATMNSVMREIAVDKEKKTITLYHAFGKRKYTFSEYFNMYGETVDQFIIRTYNEAIALNNAIFRSFFIEDTIVARGVDRNALSRFGITSTDSEVDIKRKLGSKYMDKGFMSCTPVLDGGFTDKKVNFVMTCKKGMAFADFSSFNSGEQEILLGLGSVFSVDDVKKIGDKIIIYMTSIN